MSYPARALMAALAVCVIWTAIRACRSGTIFSEGTGYSAEQQPAIFALGLAAHGFIVAFLLWLAAGYDQRCFFRLLGLDRLMSWFLG
jgi:hypothetical protein